MFSTFRSMILAQKQFD